MSTKAFINQDDTSVLGSKRAWFIVGCAGLFYSYQFVIRVFPNVLQNEVMTALGIDAAAFGLMVGFYYWTYAGLQLPLGIAMDRIGPRILLSMAGVVCGIACLIFSLTTNFYVASFARFLMGMGAASGLLGTIKLGTMWFPPHKIGNVVALAMVFGTSGAVMGNIPLRFLIDQVGWEGTLQVLGALGVLIAGLIYVFVQNTPKGNTLSDTHHPKDEKLLTGLITVLKSPQAWFISGVSTLMYAPIIIMGDAWSTSFVVSIYGISRETAGLAATCMFVGAAIGSPFFTQLSDRLRSRRIPIYIGCFTSLAVYMTMVFGSVSEVVMFALFFIAGFSYTAKCLCFASMTEIMPPSSSGVSVGFSNMLVMLFGAVYHPLIGLMLDLSWNGLEINGNNIYSEVDYRFALTIIPICLSLSLFLLGFIKETHPARPHRLIN